MTIDTFYVFFDLTIIGLVCYVTHLLRCIARNTRKPDNKDLFRTITPSDKAEESRREKHYRDIQLP